MNDYLRPRTRLAPSPTGALHLGNARTFLVNWALARQQGWEIVLRIEDLDGPRVKPESAQQAIDILTWLGIDWDDGPYFQSHELAPYDKACRRLASAGEIYPCTCTRRKIEAASLSAPHETDHELRYPGTCRPPVVTAVPNVRPDSPYLDADVPLRLITADERIEFRDQFAGLQRFNPQQECGDFIVRTRDRRPSYQLAVVVDDVRQGITHIVRGDDLLSSTARQILLYRALGYAPPPLYYHLPLAVGADGLRLAKRHGDTRILYYREAGVSAERIVGLLAEWCGMGTRRPLTATEFLQDFDLDLVPRHRIEFSEADDRWLLGLEI